MTNIVHLYTLFHEFELHRNAVEICLRYLLVMFCVSFNLNVLCSVNVNKSQQTELSVPFYSVQYRLADLLSFEMYSFENRSANQISFQM